MSEATSLERAPAELSAGREVYLKREDRHELGAFKWRGALPTLTAYRERGASAVVTASTGNHGAATAWSAARLGLSAIVFVPREASAAKLELMRRWGAQIREAGRDFDEAKEAARELAARDGVPFFEDGCEPAQYEGYEAIGDEIFDQLGRDPEAVVVPVGNGALITGVGEAVRRRSQGRTRVIGVTAREAPVMAMSFEAGHPVACDRMATFADGLAVRVAIERPVRSMREVVERVLLVSEREIARAIGAFAGSGIRVEGAAAAPLAALPQLGPTRGPVVLVVTGRNIDEELFQRAVTRPESFPE